MVRCGRCLGQFKNLVRCRNGIFALYTLYTNNNFTSNAIRGRNCLPLAGICIYSYFDEVMLFIFWLFVLFVCVLCLMCQMLLVSLDCQFFIAGSVVTFKFQEFLCFVWNLRPLSFQSVKFLFVNFSRGWCLLIKRSM